jgi:alpha-D-ribose 1-methylphosphonate 5-triphosphate diphosphatase
MNDFALYSTRVLTPEGIRPATLRWRDGLITAVVGSRMDDAADCGDALLAPGLIDLHGDAFERQIMPRPAVRFPLDVALIETDRQLVANGITTAFHGITCSWEGGLRSYATGRAFCDALEALLPRLAVQHKVHWRFEAYSLEALAPTLAMLRDGDIDLLALNNHMPAIRRKIEQAGKLAEYAERAETDGAIFRERVRKALAREHEVPDALRDLAATAREFGIPLASHDDTTLEDRALSRSLGTTICEFPLNETALEDARACASAIVLGAPNVLRGGSHCGGMSAADLVARGRCDVLVSDYYYPALFHAPFRLAASGAASLEAAWALASSNAARAGGLSDRGSIAAGLRADLLLIDDAHPMQPRLQSAWVGGRQVYHSEPLPA